MFQLPVEAAQENVKKGTETAQQEQKQGEPGKAVTCEWTGEGLRS